MKRFIAAVCGLIILSATAAAAVPNDSRFVRNQWTAQWIDVPGSDTQAYGVYYFRKTLSLDAKPGTYPVMVSADNRYKLYVNGTLVSLGPARCDIEHWYYETVDLAPLLKSGKNAIAAMVWNEGPGKAEAQFSLRTAFILQGIGESESLVTDKSWKCTRDESFGVSRAGRVFGYSVVSPDEQIDMSKRIHGWMDAEFDDSMWADARQISAGTPKLTEGIDCGKTWRLVPSPLPQMEMTPQRFGEVRKSDGVTISGRFPAEQVPITIPAHTKASFLLDNKVLTNAYPTVLLSKGAGATLNLTYAEALYDRRFRKGNRNDIEDKMVFGRTDVILADGSANQSFTSLFYRTFRYVNVTVETADEPLVIEDIRSTFTGFPFELKARLETSDRMINAIFDNGWRTARLCAVETYMDCPYYEQLQYAGDARVQALVSLFDTGDTRLVKNLIRHIDNSRQNEGITQSRYPSVNPQIIPLYSLCHIWSLHDLMMYGNEPEFIEEMIPGMRQILSYYRRFQDESGSIAHLPNWTFVDWATDFERGKAPLGKDGSSSIIDLFLALAYQKAAEIESAFGMKEMSSIYIMRSEEILNAVQSKYWNEARGLYADNTDMDRYSQHANALAILTGLIKGEEARNLALKIQNDASLTQATLYFKYYTHEAMTKAGLGDNYISWLDVWRRNIELGLTTLGETSDVEGTRSDCHAWSASPNVEFFRTVLGIDSATPGFGRVIIKPALGDITEIGGTMPHPEGLISLKYSNRSRLEAEVTLPEGVSGTFIWKGKSVPLKSGKNKLSL